RPSRLGGGPRAWAAALAPGRRPSRRGAGPRAGAAPSRWWGGGPRAGAAALALGRRPSRRGGGDPRRQAAGRPELAGYVASELLTRPVVRRNQRSST